MMLTAPGAGGPVDQTASDHTGADPALFIEDPIQGDPSYKQHGKRSKGKAKDSKGPSVTFGMQRLLLPCQK